jgi:hypothetical protein
VSLTTIRIIGGACGCGTCVRGVFVLVLFLEKFVAHIGDGVKVGRAPVNNVVSSLNASSARPTDSA